MAKDKQNLPTISAEPVKEAKPKDKGKPEEKKEKGGYKRKKGRKNVPVGIIHVKATFNNTVINITDIQGNTIAWCSAGMKGFRGSRKSTPFAAQIAADDAARKAMDNGIRSASARVKGPGAGREAALRAISAAGIRITGIQDVTPIPHNGCRPPKRRRV